MNPGNITLKEMSQTQKHKYCMISLIREILIKIAKLTEAKSRIVVARGRGVGGEGGMGRY